MVEVRNLEALTDLKARADVQRLVKAENSDRQELYKEIAAAKNVDLAQLPKIREPTRHAAAEREAGVLDPAAGRQLGQEMTVACLPAMLGQQVLEPPQVGLARRGRPGIRRSRAAAEVLRDVEAPAGPWRSCARRSTGSPP
jgi:hypothetical protein